MVDEILEDNNSDSTQVEFPENNCQINIPQGLSPNGDGFNDFFNIEGLYNIFLNHKLLIYNRYGSLVFVGNNDKKWDGTSNHGIFSNSKRLPTGTYFYVLYLNEDNYSSKTGWVYLNY